MITTTQILAQDRSPEERASRQLTVFDAEANVVRTLGEPAPWFTPRFSPDSTRVAASLWTPGESEDLWIFDLATGIGTRITDGEFNNYPVWSSDGGEVAYVGERGSEWNIYRRAANGAGEEQLVYRQAGTPIYLFDWSQDGRFLSFSEVVYREGEPVETALKLLPVGGNGEPIDVQRSESILAWGKLSPDSRFLVYRSNETGRAEVFVQSVAHLTTTDTNADTSPLMVDKWRISMDGGVLAWPWTRQRPEIPYFDPDGELMIVALVDGEDLAFGRPRRLLTAPISPFVWPGSAGDLSRDGLLLVFAAPLPPPRFQITVFDRDGNIVGRPGEPQPYHEAAISPDGSRVAVVRRDPATNERDLWIVDVETGDRTRLTADSAWEKRPTWSADGRAVAFQGGTGIYLQPIDGSGETETLFRFPAGFAGGLDDLSADGRYLSRDGGSIVTVVSLVGGTPGNRQESEVVREAFDAFGARFSPDGRYLAYLSDESGRFEVYVRPLDISAPSESSAKTWQLSNDGSIGGIVWRADGRELFYLQRDGQSLDVRVMAVDVNVTPDFEAGTPRFLFQVSDTLAPSAGNEALVISGDGQQVGSVGKVISSNGQRFVFLLPAR